MNLRKNIVYKYEKIPTGIRRTKNWYKKREHCPGIIKVSEIFKYVRTWEHYLHINSKSLKLVWGKKSHILSELMKI